MQLQRASSPLAPAVLARALSVSPERVDVGTLLAGHAPDDVLVALLRVLRRDHHRRFFRTALSVLMVVIAAGFAIFAPSPTPLLPLRDMSFFWALFSLCLVIWQLRAPSPLMRNCHRALAAVAMGSTVVAVPTLIALGQLLEPTSGKRSRAVASEVARALRRLLPRLTIDEAARLTEPERAFLRRQITRTMSLVKVHRNDPYPDLALSEYLPVACLRLRLCDCRPSGSDRGERHAGRASRRAALARSPVRAGARGRQRVPADAAERAVSQQALDRERVVTRLRERLSKGEFCATDPLLDGLDPTSALTLLVEALRPDWLAMKKFYSFPDWLYQFAAFLALYVFFCMTCLFISIPLKPPMMFVLVMLAARCTDMLVQPRKIHRKRLANGAKGIAEFSRRADHSSALPPLLEIGSWMVAEPTQFSPESMHDVEKAVDRLVAERTAMGVPPLSPEQQGYLLLRTQQKANAQPVQDDAFLVNSLLILGAEREAALAPLAAELARSAPSEAVRRVAAEVFWDLKESERV